MIFILQRIKNFLVSDRQQYKILIEEIGNIFNLNLINIFFRNREKKTREKLFILF